MKNLLLIISIGLIMVSCDKEDNYSLYYWNQTKCADPWNTEESHSNQQTSEAVTDFLENNGISVIEIDFENNSALDTMCKACSCGTGQRIVVEVMNKDDNKMKNLDFYE